MFKKFILEVMGALETQRFIARRLGLGEVIILFVGRWGLGSGMRWALNWDDYKEEVVVLKISGRLWKGWWGLMFCVSWRGDV
jgi:hypothetical protein